MLLFDLAKNFKDQTKRPFTEFGRAELSTVWIGLVVVGVISALLWNSREELYLLRLRPINIAERDAVVSLCGRLRTEWPQDNEEISDFLKQFERGELSAYVDDYAKVPSIEVDGDRIVFSKPLFSASWRLQSKTFAIFLQGGEESLPDLPPIDEIARRKD